MTKQLSNLARVYFQSQLLAALPEGIDKLLAVTIRVKLLCGRVRWIHSNDYSPRLGSAPGPTDTISP